MTFSSHARSRNPFPGSIPAHLSAIPAILCSVGILLWRYIINSPEEIIMRNKCSNILTIHSQNHSQHPKHPETTLQMFCVLNFQNHFCSKLLCYRNTDHKAEKIPTLSPDQRFTQPTTLGTIYWGLNCASNIATKPSTTKVSSTVLCPHFLLAKICTESFEFKNKKVNTYSISVLGEEGLWMCVTHSIDKSSWV